MHVTWSQGESELVAKDDNLDAADPNKDKKTEDKDQQMDTEEKEKINEQGDQVTFITPELFSFCKHAALQFAFISSHRDPIISRNNPLYFAAK